MTKSGVEYRIGMLIETAEQKHTGVLISILELLCPSQIDQEVSDVFAGSVVPPMSGGPDSSDADSTVVFVALYPGGIFEFRMVIFMPLSRPEVVYPPLKYIETQKACSCVAARWIAIQLSSSPPETSMEQVLYVFVTGSFHQSSFPSL